MKKTYQKPKIAKVKLVPEEAVLEKCKTRTDAGPGGNECLGGPPPKSPACRGHGS